MEMKCLGCGWEGPASEVQNVTVREYYGDVSVLRCPSCRRIEYDGMELLVEAGGKR